MDLGANSVLTTTGDYVQAAGSTNLGETTSRLAASGALVRVQGGTLKGVGSVDPALNVIGGTVAPGLSPGTLRAAGSYTQGSGSVLEVEIGGTVAGTGYDQLDATTTASLGGTLDIKTLSGFVPSPGSAFTILQCGATDCRSGEFAAVQGTTPGGNREYQVQYNARDVVLNVVDTSPIDTSLSLVANPNTLIFGQRTTLSGKLTRTVGGEGVSGKQVILEHKPAGATSFTQVGSGVSTDTSGNFSFTNVRPSKNTEYRARFAGDQASRLNASTSSVQLVRVKIKLTVTVTPTTMKLGEKPVIAGVVSPAHTGSVKLTIKRGKTVLVNRRSVSLSNSRYRFVYNKPPSTGSYTVTVSFVPTDGDHLGNTATKGFKVTR